MASVRDYLEGQKQQKLDAAAELSKAAEDASRPNTDGEKGEIIALLDAVGSLDVQIKAIDDQEELRDRIDSIRGPVAPAVEEHAKGAMSIGEAFVKSDGYNAVKEAGFVGKWTTGVLDLPWQGKTLVTETASPIVTIDTQPNIIPLPGWPLRVADLFMTGTTTSNSVRLITDTTETNNAAGVAEGDPKPESVIVAANVDFPVGKIATSLPVTDEMLEDVQQMQSFLNGRLSLFVARKEDSDLLNGAGAPTVKGILAFSGIQTSSALALDTDSSIDAIFKAMTAVRVTGLYEPDAIVMHPTDWSGVRLMKDTAKQYYGGGPFTGAYGGNGGIASDNLWGLPVVVTTAIAQGTALVGAFKTAAQIFRRKGLTVEASNSHDTNFTHNIVTIRAEERLALAVWRESAFFKITGVDSLLGS